MDYHPKDFSVGESVRIYSRRSRKSGVYVRDGIVVSTRSTKPLRGRESGGLALRLQTKRGTWLEVEEFERGKRVATYDLPFAGTNDYRYAGIIKAERVRIRTK